MMRPAMFLPPDEPLHVTFRMCLLIGGLIAAIIAEVSGSSGGFYAGMGLVLLAFVWTAFDS